MSGAEGRSVIDWAEVARQVQRGAAALEGFALPDHQGQARLLRARAKALAGAETAAADTDTGSDGIEVLAFAASGESYAFETAWVARVIPMAPLTAIPNVPVWIAGVTMFEGEVLAVLDLRTLLALPLSDMAEPGGLVVLQGEGRSVALLADAIHGVRRYPRTALGHCLPALAAIDRSYLLGVAPDRTALLDAGRLLTDSTLVVHADR